ncbi:MAG: hypothetical protein FWF35_01985 [Elusimicrobia bacterium]|nr:hypothetical protein [Elusimicrobiota bacterium]
MKSRLIMSAIFCFAAASVFAAYVYTDDSKTTAQADNQLTQTQQAQRGSSSLLFTNGGKVSGGSASTIKPGNASGGMSRSSFTSITTGTTGADGTCTPCDSTCPTGQARTSNSCQEDTGGCCVTKTLCAAVTCQTGYKKTGNTYDTDIGGCCDLVAAPACTSPKVLVNGVCKTPCFKKCLSGQVRNPKVNYTEDGECCIACVPSGTGAQCLQLAID